MITLPAKLIKNVTVGRSVARYGDLPCPNTKNPDTAILFMTGQKSPLERFWPMSQYMAQFYHTYNYEIPGMGVAKRNPESPATISTLSDEVGEFMKKVITEKNIILVAGSVGFWFSTEAIQTNPDLQRRVKKVIALAGMLGKETFGFSPIRRNFYLLGCSIAKRNSIVRATEWFLQQKWFIDAYSKVLIKRRHLSHLDPPTQKEYEEFEKFLLRSGDWKIHFSTVAQYLTTSPRFTTRLNIPLLALYSPKDQFFPRENQQRMFSSVYPDITWVEINTKNHAPLIVKNWREYSKLIPEEKIISFLSS